MGVAAGWWRDWWFVMLVCLRWLLFVGVVGSLVGCQSSGGPGDGVGPSVVSVSIDQGEVVAVEVGASLALSATVVVVGGADDSVVWKASCGVVSSAGSSVIYVAPDEVSDCVVRVVSAVDASVEADAMVLVRAVPEVKHDGVVPAEVELNELGRAGVVSSAGDVRFDVVVEEAGGASVSGALVVYEEFGSVALIRAVHPVSGAAAVHLHDLSAVVVGSSGVVEDSSLIVVGVGVGLTLLAGAVVWNNAAVLLREVEVTFESIPTASPEDGVVEMCVTPEDLVYLLVASAAAQQQEIEALKVLGKGVVFTALGAHHEGFKAIGALSDLGHIATANPTGLVEDVREYARSALNVPGFSGDEHLEVTFVGYQHKPAIAGGVSWSAVVFSGAGCDPDAFLAETGTVAITSPVSDIEPDGDAVVTVRVDRPAAGVEVYLYQESRLDGRVTYTRRFPPETTDVSGEAMFRVPVYALGGTAVRAVVPERRVSTVAELQWRYGAAQRQSPQLFNVNLIGRHAIVGEPATIYYSIGESGRLSACEVDWGEGRGWESFDCPPRGWFGYSIQASSRKLDHTFTRTGLFRPTLRFTNEEGYMGSASLVLAVMEPHVNSPPEILSATYDGERLDWQFRDDDVLDLHRCFLMVCRGPDCPASDEWRVPPITAVPYWIVLWSLDLCPRIGSEALDLALYGDGLMLRVTDGSASVQKPVMLGSPPPVHVTIAPSSDVLEVGASRRFEAAVSGTIDERLDWSATCGEIAGSGGSVEYTAPPSVPAGGICTIRATSRFDAEAWGEAVVTVTPDPTTPGYLGVTILGLPSDVPAAVTVTGPGDYYRSVSSSTSLTVPPGDYVVAAQTVAAGSQAYRATPASQEAAVAAGAATSATVTYRLGDSDVTVRVEPASARLPVLGRQEFVALVEGSSNTAVQWSLVPASGCGFVIVSGNTVTYNAPDAPAVCSVRATSVADEAAWDEATVTVTAGPEVSVSPPSVSLAPERQHEFTAEVKGASDTSVTWSATCGSITESGSTIIYTAPASVPPGGVCFVRATSVADEAAWGEATVTVEPAVGNTVMSVSNVDGQPAEGVTVMLSGAGGTFSAVSGGNGVAQFVDVPAGEYDAEVWLRYDGAGQYPLRDEFWGSAEVTVTALSSSAPSFTRDMPYMTDGLAFPATVQVNTNASVSTNVVNPAGRSVRPRLLLDRPDCTPAGCGNTGVAGASTTGTSVSASVTPTGTGEYRFYLALETNVDGTWRVTDQLAGFSFGFTVSGEQDPVSVSLSPSSATIEVNGSEQFTASVTGATNTSVTWSTTCGSISGSGSTVTYTAPPSVPAGGTCLVSATSDEDDSAWAEAVATIEPATSDPPPTAPSATIAAGGFHSLALRADGTVWAWGENEWGQLGDGSTTDRLTPVQVSGLSNVTSITAGYSHSLALRTDGTVWAWGDNWYGQLGDGSSTTEHLTPVQVSGLSNVTSITAGWQHSLALRMDGTVWAWGRNHHGQLGDGSTTDRLTPVQVSGLSNVTSITAGYWHSLALRTDGTVWAWGYNGAGQLGDGTSTTRLTPVQVSGLSNAASITAGWDHSLALRTDGTVWAWGNNWYGQLGDGSTTSRYTPVQVSGLSNVTSSTAGGDHSLAWRSDGTVWAWGANWYGQLGDGTTTGRLTPVRVSGLSNVTSMTAGRNHSLAWRSDGSVWAWGQNGAGQLGDGTTTDRLTPVQVSGF